MSRKHGHRKHRHRERPGSLPPAQALAAVATILNAAESRLHLRIRHGVLWSDFGVILPPGKKEPWCARPFRPGPAPRPDDLDD